MEHFSKNHVLSSMFFYPNDFETSFFQASLRTDYQAIAKKELTAFRGQRSPAYAIKTFYGIVIKAAVLFKAR